MRSIFIFITLFVFSLALKAADHPPIAKAIDNNRLIILADMGNEPDEEQQIFHLLMYSNEIDIEGLVAVTGKFLNPQSSNPAKQKLYPELFSRLIEGYSKVTENLKKHAEGWPTPEYLNSIIRTGQRGYGMSDVGEGKSSPGSQLIVQSLTNNDQRPLYVIVNAGSNTLAQALFDLKLKYSGEQLANIISKLRVFENGAQDNAGAWICKNFTEINWIRSNYQTYCYGGPAIDGGFDNKGKNSDLGPYLWKPYAYNGTGQHQWLLENIIGGHGPFGNYYPLRQFPNGGISFMEGGGTIPFLGLVNKGLYDINNPWWGGWSGRYSRKKGENYWSKHQSVKVDEAANSPFKMYVEEADSWIDNETGTVYTDNLFAPVWRWRKATYNDFTCRMDWCNKPFDAANHNPMAVLNGDSTNKILMIASKPGKVLNFDASSSFDYDNDSLSFNWFVYNEAGTYNGNTKFLNSTAMNYLLEIPSDAANTEIQLILEVSDNNKLGSMYDYRRMVISVEK